MNNNWLLILFVATLLVACGPADQTPPVNENNDKVAVVITGWGEPKGFDLNYRKQVRRAQTGASRRYPFEPCTEMFAGRWPFASQVGLLPYAVGYKLPVLGGAYDSMGIYRKSQDGSEYIALFDDSVRLKASDIPDVDGIIIPVTESTLFASRSIHGIDPRDGSNYLENIYQIGAGSRERGPNPLALPNGLSDVSEIGLAGSMADMSFMYTDLKPRPNKMDQLMSGTAMAVLKRLFGDRLSVKFGAYAETPGVYELEEKVAVDLVQQGFRKLILTRETTDNNNYANEFMTRGYVYYGLCQAGLADDVEIKQTRQVGRTPEYNTALLEILRPHLQALEEGSEAAIIYTTYGMPFPGSKSTGPFGVAHPLAKDVYHENAYLNYQSFKRYAQDEFGDRYQLQFNRLGKTGDKRTDSYYAYAMFTSEFYGAPDDPLRFPTIRETINQAKQDGRSNIIVLLSHWNHTNTDNMLGMRLMNQIPFNSREDMANKKYWQAWCELPGSSEPVACDEKGAISLQFSEVFDKQAVAFGIGYGQRIRGTVERYGLFPEGVEPLAIAPVTALSGGELVISEGPLAGVAVSVPADPAPGKPESFEWDAYEAFVDPAQMFVGAWFDFDLYVAEQEDTVASDIYRVVSPVVLVGPYRTIVNKPATITLPFDPAEVEQAESLVAVIFNEVTEDWDRVYPVAGGAAMVVDAVRGSVSFDVQVLGMFALAVKNEAAREELVLLSE